MSTPEELNPSDVLVLECQKKLGTGKDYDMPHVLKCFEASLWALNENQELTTETKADVVLAKNILLRDIVINQVKTIGQFRIESPLKNSCGKCRGTGEVYKFSRKSKKVKCMKCTEGKIILDCTSCSGTGRVTEEIDEGEGVLHNNVLCKACKGKNIDGKSDKTQVQFKCPTCRGKQKVKKFAIIEELKSTTPCRFCKGMGFKEPKPERQPSNPVIAKNLGDAIKGNSVPPIFVSGTTQSEKEVLDEGCFKKKQLPASD